jgi:hypothetical protein
MIDFSKFNFDDIGDDEEGISLEDAMRNMKESIDKYSSEALCSIIASDRHLKINRELQVICLEELDRRRASGDLFDFDTCIKKKIDAYPKINMSLGKVQDLFDSVKKNIKL